MYRIGKDIDISCTFDLSRLTSVNQYEHPNYENRFFELYLVDWNDDLIDVPILITSILSETGQMPNFETDESRWILTRRFFLFDTVSGIPEGQFPGGQA